MSTDAAESLSAICRRLARFFFSQRGLRTTISCLIAATSVAGALVLWRVTDADSKAGERDLSGLTATRNLNETIADANLDLYQGLRAYSLYRRFNDLPPLIDEDLRSLPPEEAAALQSQRAQARSLAVGMLDSFKSDYLRADGSYNERRHFGEFVADIALTKDLGPEAHFVDADEERDRAEFLVGALIALSLSVLLYTVARGMTRNLRYVPALTGVAFMIGGFVTALTVELT